jgi:hypothetical protein
VEEVYGIHPHLISINPKLEAAQWGLQDTSYSPVHLQICNMAEDRMPRTYQVALHTQEAKIWVLTTSGLNTQGLGTTHRNIKLIRLFQELHLSMEGLDSWVEEATLCLGCIQLTSLQPQ